MGFPDRKLRLLAELVLLGTGDILASSGHTMTRPRDRQTDQRPEDPEDDSCSVLRAPVEPGLRQSW